MSRLTNYMLALIPAGLALAVLAGCRHTSTAPPTAQGMYRGAASVGTLTSAGWVEGEADIEGAGDRRRVRFRGGRDWFDGSGVWPTGGAYQLERASGPEICGHTTTRETLIHTASGRIAATRNLDSETGVELRREVYRSDGILASRTEVTDIDYRVSVADWGPIESATPTAGQAMAPEEFREQAGFEPVEPSHIPAGYVKEGFYGHTCERGRWYGEFRYHDGLRSLSIYERHPQGEQGGRGGNGGQGRRAGEGRGRASREGGGRPQVLDHGVAITVRERRGDLVVLATGDITVDEGIAIVESVPVG